MMASISVVIPCLDDAAMLQDCLAALAKQSRRADEVIVVDNGSSDDSVAVARAAGARVVTEPRRGIWPATAAGFDAAGGELLARLDADSVPPADWLERIERRMSAPDGPTALTGPGRFYGGNAATRWLGRHLYLGGYFWAIGIVLGHPPLFGSNCALRRDAWLEVRTLVRRERADVHDDLDLSWWLQPDMTVALDRELEVGVSARPFDTWGALGRRLRMAFHTLALEWRDWPPLERLAERRAAAAPVAARDETDPARDEGFDEGLEEERPAPA